MRSHRMMRSIGPEDEKLGRAYDLRLVLRLLQYVRPYKLLAYTSILAMGVYAATTVAYPWIIREAVDSVIPPQSTSKLTMAAVFLVVNALVGYAANYLNLITLTTSELSLHRCPAVKARRMATPSNSGHSAHGS